MAAIPALLLFVVLHGVFFHDVAFEGRSLSAATLTAGLTPRGPLDAPADSGPPHVLDVEGAAWVDEPSPYLARAAFAAGELPLWNPGTGLGAPLAANLNSGAGNPLQLPLNLLPTPAVADAFYLGRLLLLALFTWAFLRELGLSSFAAFVGATIITYGGYPLAWIVHHPLSSELFLPLMLYGFERGRRGRANGWIVLAAAAALSLFGGKLQASLLCFAFTGLYVLARATPARGGAGRRTIVAGVAGLILGGVAAAILLLPAHELMARASGLTLGGRAQLAGYTVPWPSLASLAVPELFVAPGRVFADGLLTPAIGIVAVVLAAVGIAARATPFAHVARLCAAWAVLFLLRNAGAFGDLATRLPVVRGILFVKYTFTIVFALAVAAAIGIDAIVAGRIDVRRAARAICAALLVIAACVAAALRTDGAPTFAAALAAPIATATVVALAVVAWRMHWLGRGGVATALALVLLTELWWSAPHAHPPRVALYRPPAYVEYLQTAAPGRVIADADLVVPLTSAAAGLRDVRSIDVLTPGASFAFFTRLVSFCDRVIHFTVDPDVPLAATAPALDLVGVRYVVTRTSLDVDAGDLAGRVRKQVGRERTARLLAGLERLWTEGEPLAIGPIAVGDDERFAFTLATPFTLEVTGESEAAELAWGVLVRGPAAAVALRIGVDGVPADAPADPVTIATEDRWVEHHVALAHAGERRRIRLRITGVSTDGGRAQVSFGSLGFGPGAAIEARLAAERGARQVSEASALRPVFRDPDLGVVVYENTNALARAFRVQHVEPAASEEAALTRLGDGFDFRRTALVGKEEIVAVNAALVNAESDAGVDAATSIRAETPGTVTIATAGPTSALLVLADLAFPGWYADIDGQTAPVLTVDGVLRGVVVPAGSHAVTFRYRPTSWLLGALISSLALAALLPYGRASARAHGGGDRT